MSKRYLSVMVGAATDPTFWMAMHNINQSKNPKRQKVGWMGHEPCYRQREKMRAAHKAAAAQSAAEEAQKKYALTQRRKNSKKNKRMEERRKRRGNLAVRIEVCE